MMFTGTLTNFDGSWTCEVAGEWTITKQMNPKPNAWSGWLQAIDGAAIKAGELYILDLMNGQPTAIRMLQREPTSVHDSRLTFHGSGPLPATPPIQMDNGGHRPAAKFVA